MAAAAPAHSRVTLSLSIVEIYNNTIKDLLGDYDAKHEVGLYPTPSECLVAFTCSVVWPSFLGWPLLILTHTHTHARSGG
jgi:hypothetical protein